MSVLFPTQILDQGWFCWEIAPLKKLYYLSQGSITRLRGSTKTHSLATTAALMDTERDCAEMLEKNNLLKMTGSLLGPKWQHLNTQYARR